MQDPSYGVPTPLLPHIHLVSDFRFPVLHNLSQEQIVEYLTHAPRIVKDQQPMSWQYFSNPPPDGTVLLVWQPDRQRGLHFASDGYLYVDPEQRHQLEIGGCTIEVYAQRQAWRYRQEQFTAHSRYRYRIIHRNPAFPGQFDQSLWLVHYQSLAHQQRIPAANMRLNPQQSKEVQDRTMLEQSGQLARRPFMLHDSSNWPQVQFSPMQRGPMPGGYPNMQMGGVRPGFGGQQPGQAQGLVGQPPAKRMRTNTGGQPGVPGAMQPPMGAIQHDPFVEEEENVAMGDVIDHMTPRDISIVRYTQHHEWMEEIFSSPYAAHQIVPLDLGLGLSGELADLTRDILDAPGEKIIVAERREAPVEYKKLAAEKKKEIEQRMDAFEKRQQEEIERMKLEHAQVMAKLKKSRTYIRAERQLKDGTGAAADGGWEDVVSNVESTLGVKIGSRTETVCVSKGGLIEEEPKPAPPPAATAAAQPAAGDSVSQNGANGEINGAQLPGGSLDLLGSNGTSINTPGANASTPAGISQVGTPGLTGGLQLESEFTLEGIEGPGAADDGMDLLDDMDIDSPHIPDSNNLDSLAPDAASGAAPDDWVMVDDSTAKGPSGDASAPSTAAAQATLEQTATQPATDAPPAGQAAAAVAAGEQQPAQQPAAPTGATPGDEQLFGDAAADFNDFANLEDAAGDALADFGGDADGDLADLGLDNSAFDDLDGVGGDAGGVQSQGPAAEAAAAVDAAAEPAVAVAQGEEPPVTLGGAGEDAAAAGEGAGTVDTAASAPAS